MAAEGRGPLYLSEKVQWLGTIMLMKKRTTMLVKAINDAIAILPVLDQVSAR